MANRFITGPSGSGTKDGLTYANAYDPTVLANWQTAVDALTPGDTLFIDGTIDLSGATFSQHLMTINNSGTSLTSPIYVTAYNTSSPPTITGNWLIADPQSATARNFMIFAQSVNYINVSYLITRNWKFHFSNTTSISTTTPSGGGLNVGLRLSNLNSAEGRLGHNIIGDPDSTPSGDPTPANNSTDIFYSACVANNFTMGGFRCQNGANGVTYNYCTANSGGTTYGSIDNQSDQAGFNSGQGSTASYNIIYNHCVSRNNATAKSAGTQWQGDGFLNHATSFGSYGGHVYNFCEAYSNADGGFDDGAVGTYNNCVAAKNLKNWKNHNAGGAVIMKNCLAHSACHNDGGAADGTSNCFNILGAVTAYNCTFHNILTGEPTGQKVISMQVDSGDGWAVNFINCIYSQSNTTATGSILFANTTSTATFTATTTTTWDEPGVTGTNPNYINPLATFEGFGNNYDNNTYSHTRGWFTRIFASVGSGISGVLG